jgi:single-strand DNA-binding protein
MNQVILSGRLTSDPQTRQTKTGLNVCNFGLAVDRPNARKDNPVTDFFDCVSWGRPDGGSGLAGVIQKYFHKGDAIIISAGVLQTDQWTDSTGTKRTKYQISVQQIEFPPYRKSAEAQPTAPAPAPASPAAPSTFLDDEPPF